MAHEKREKTNKIRAVKFNFSSAPTKLALLQSIRSNQLCESENLVTQVLTGYSLNCPTVVAFGDHLHYTHLLKTEHEEEPLRRLAYIELCQKYYPKNIPFLKQAVEIILMIGEKIDKEVVETLLEGLDEAIEGINNVRNTLESLNKALGECFSRLNNALAVNNVPIKFVRHLDFVDPRYETYAERLEKQSHENQDIQKALHEYAEKYVYGKYKNKDEKFIKIESSYFEAEILQFLFTAIAQGYSHYGYAGDLGFFNVMPEHLFGNTKVNGYLKKNNFNSFLFDDNVFKSCKATQIIKLTFGTYNCLEDYKAEIEKARNKSHAVLPGEFLPVIEVKAQESTFQPSSKVESHDMRRDEKAVGNANALTNTGVTKDGQYQKGELAIVKKSHALSAPVREENQTLSDVEDDRTASTSSSPPVGAGYLAETVANLTNKFCDDPEDKPLVAAQMLHYTLGFGFFKQNNAAPSSAASSNSTLQTTPRSDGGSSQERLRKKSNRSKTFPGDNSKTFPGESAGLPFARPRNAGSIGNSADLHSSTERYSNERIVRSELEISRKSGAKATLTTQVTEKNESETTITYNNGNGH